MRRGGLYRYEQTVPPELWFVLPRTTSRWSTKLPDKLLHLFRECLQDITGSTFRLNVTAAHDCDDIVRQLADKRPSTAVVVLDEREFDGSAYYLLSERLQEKQEWRLKRLTRRTLEEAWRRREEAHGDGARVRAEGHWRDVVYHSVLDVLDQMDAVPWHIASWPYNACLAIDVAADRRYFGLSILVCRDPQNFPGVAGFARVVDSCRPSRMWTVKRLTRSCWRTESRSLSRVSPAIGFRKFNRFWCCGMATSAATRQTRLTARGLTVG